MFDDHIITESDVDIDERSVGGYSHQSVISPNKKSQTIGANDNRIQDNLGGEVSYHQA